MDMRKMITAIMAIVVMIVLVVTVAVPVLSSLESTSVSGENTPMMDLGRFTISEESYTLTIESDGIRLNGELCREMFDSQTTLFLSDSFSLGYDADSISEMIYLTGISPDGTLFDSLIENKGAAIGSTITITEGTATYTPSDSASVTTFQYNILYSYTPDGEYALFIGEFKASPSITILCFSQSTDFCFVEIKGNEIIDATAYKISDDTATPVTLTGATTGYVVNDDGTVSYTSPFQFTYSGGSIGGLAVVPIHYEGQVQSDIGDIIAVIPVIMVVGALIAAVGVFIPLRS